jgi:hypothetical protein
MSRYSLVLIAGLVVAGSAGAATWADGLFDELSKDFGSVPRGPAQKHNFRLVNKTKQAVNISNVKVSCGCLTAYASPKTYLQPGEETTIITSMDTTRFTGAKSVTVTVTFDRPNFEEVRLWVQANSRNDFMVTPDTFGLGQVKRGTTPTATVRVTFYGNSSARIESAKGESNYVQPVIKEVHRLDTGEVAYDVTAKLRADTPVGKWYTDVWVKTNILTMPQVRVPLTVEVESPLTISPPVLALGSLKKENEEVRRIIVRGAQPFTIKEIKGTDGVVEVKPASKEAREVHVLSVKTRPGKAGAIDRTLRVITDLKADGEIDFKVQANVTD